MKCVALTPLLRTSLVYEFKLNRIRNAFFHVRPVLSEYCKQGLETGPDPKASCHEFIADVPPEQHDKQPGFLRMPQDAAARLGSAHAWQGSADGKNTPRAD